MTVRALTIPCSLFLLSSVPLEAQTLTRISVGTDGTEGDEDSTSLDISFDGRFVVFYSEASNLVAGDTNDADDIFVHDRLTGTTVLASVNSGGIPGNDESEYAAISADGSCVAIFSHATNLVRGDTNGTGDIFVRDLRAGRTERVSVASSGEEANALSPFFFDISGDGRFVAFGSYATNLVTGDSNDAADVFVRDRGAGRTIRVSVASDGGQGDRESARPSLSLDGRYVAFASLAANLVPGDTNRSWDVFVHDIVTRTTSRVSLASDGAQGNSGSTDPSISADGRYVAFQSAASNLVDSDANGTFDIFVHDRTTGRTRIASVSTDGVQVNGYTTYPKISGDGRFVVFRSHADNLVPGDTNANPDIFLRDLLTQTTVRLSVSTTGAQAEGFSSYPGISGDGRHVTFYSTAPNLVSNDTNGARDVFVLSAARFGRR